MQAAEKTQPVMEGEIKSSLAVKNASPVPELVSLLMLEHIRLSSTLNQKQDWNGQNW